MWKRMFVMLGIAAVVIGIIGFVKYRQIAKAIAQGMSYKVPPVAVTTLEAKGQRWQPVLHAVGSLRAVNGVEVATDLSGIVREIAFESGRPVEKGDLLVKLDTVQEEAQLRAAEASYALATANLTRQRELLSKKATSQSEYDAAAANADESEASVAQTKALIARKTIYAPFSGVLGIRQINVGQYLDAGKSIVSLESQDPIYVEFAVPQQDLPKIAINGKLHVKVAGLEDNLFEGEITAINSKVNETTRNIQIEATLSNKDGLLRSGMFAQVEVLLPAQDNVITIPATSIIYAPYGDSVYLVKASEENKDELVAVQQFVKVGPARGDQVAILSGVKEGDTVVTSGGFKLNSGAAVVINNEILPSNEVKPTPPET